MPSLSKKYPNLQFYLVEEQTTHLIQRLKNGTIYAALMAQPIEASGFKVTELFNEEFLLAVGHQHPLAHRTFIAAADLYQQNILLLEEGHCLRGQALDLCQKMNIDEVQNFRATSLETLRQMVDLGNSITLMLLAWLNNRKMEFAIYRLHNPLLCEGLLAIGVLLRLKRQFYRILLSR